MTRAAPPFDGDTENVRAEVTFTEPISDSVRSALSTRLARSLAPFSLEAAVD